jgi:antitoxin component YwqK of YwqJK toxin-antitoxin module
MLAHLNPVIPIYGIRDGHYSKEVRTQTHLQKKRNLYFPIDLTNNYDNGKPSHMKVVVNEIDTDSYKNMSIEEQNGLQFKKIEIQYRARNCGNCVIKIWKTMFLMVNSIFYNENNSKQ